MPVRPQRLCRSLGCRTVHRNANGYCNAHADLAKSFVRLAPPKLPRESSSARGYGYKWQQARTGFLSKHPLCVQCQSRGRVTAASVVDHIKPHRGDMSKFWERSNWQALCATCHSVKTAAEDGGFGNTRKE